MNGKVISVLAGALCFLAAFSWGTPALGTPYFAIESMDQWQTAMSSGKVEPVMATEWSEYMAQWSAYLVEGEPYPPHDFLPAQLYVWEGGGGGGSAPEDAGLVMVWGSDLGFLPDGSYSSAWKYDYQLDPNLTNSVITITVTAPQFNPQGAQINVVSFGIKDVNGLIRAWYWNCGPAGPIQWNTRTIITINTSMYGIGAATPAATSFMNNPGFDLTQAQWFMVDENVIWVNGAIGIPPPGQVNLFPWNYWHNLMVFPFQGIVKWAQPPTFRDPPQPPYEDCFYGWDEVSNYVGPQIVADDFLCRDDRPITDIHWWGSYLNWDSFDPPPIRPDLFHIALWTDVPAGSGDPPWSHPGTLIREWRVPIAEALEHWVGCDFHEPMVMQDACFEYGFNIPRSEWFVQPGDETIYWISISAIYLQPIQPPNPWGWKTREHFYNDDAVRIFNPLSPTVGSVFVAGEEIKDLEGNSWDMAFVLTTNRQPGMPSKPKYEQPPEPVVPHDVYLGWNEESLWDPTVTGTIAADDWVCSSPDPITKIRWWGSFINWTRTDVPPVVPNHFHITFWSDVPAQPGGFSHPDQVIHEVICTSFTYSWVGWDYDPIRNEYETCFLYEQDLLPSEYFYQPTANGIYWISIAACYQPGVPPTDYLWGWKTRPRDPTSLAPDDAVRMWNPRTPVMGSTWGSGEPLFWPTTADSWDLAFELISEPVVEPVIKWMQDPDLTSMGIDVNATYPPDTPPIQYILADDFRCTKTGPITTIEIWGSWLHDILPGGSPGNVMFTLSIHADIPDPDGTGPLYSMPGDLKWMQTFNPGQFSYTLYEGGLQEGWLDPPAGYTPVADTQCWRYTFTNFANPFIQEGSPTNPIIYWLDVQATPLDPNATFGWKTTLQHFQDDAVWGQGMEPYLGPWNELRYPPGHPMAGQSIDLALRIADTAGTKWVRPPDLTTTGIDVNCTYREGQPAQPYLLADDFPCSETGPLTRITVFGSWLNDVLPPAGSQPTFTLSIHTDIPAGDPRNPYDYSIPGETKWMRPFAPGTYTAEVFATTTEGWLDPPADYIFPADYICWKYTFDIPVSEAFVQQGTPTDPVIYWLDVQAQVPDQTARFGWKTSLAHWMDDAVWAHAVEPVPVVGPWFDLHYPPGHEMYPQSIDLAFIIEGQMEPQEPYTKWSQPPEPYTPDDGYNGWNELSVYGWNQIVADDWPCTTEFPVTDLHWWGSFINWASMVPPQLPDRFHIGIWTDVPADPNTAGSFSHPGFMLWETWCDNYNVEFVGWDWDPRDPTGGAMVNPEACFRFDQVLDRDQWFFQDPGENIYWLSIAAVYDAGTSPEYPWGWKTRPNLFMDDGVTINDPTAPAPGMEYVFGNPIEYPTGVSWDLAFTLTTLDCQMLGDMNMDGVLNGLDIQCFVDCLINGFLATTTSCNCACADMDGDGLLTVADIAPFVNALLLAP